MYFYKSLKIGDWNAAKEFLNQYPHAISAKITVRGQTALHVAADAGHVHIVEENLEIKDNEGLTALAQASYNGKYCVAECMLGKNENLIRIATNEGNIPVVRSGSLLWAFKIGSLSLFPHSARKSNARKYIRMYILYTYYLR